MLREAGQFVCQCFGGKTGLTFGGNAVGQADPQRLVRPDGSPRQDQVHRHPQTYDLRQPDSSAVNQGYPPPSTKHPERCGLLNHSQIAPGCEFQATGDREPTDRSDNGLAEHHPAWTHRCVARRLQAITSAFANGLQVRSGAEVPARTPQDRHACGWIGIKPPEGVCEFLSRLPIDSVAHFWTVNDHGPHWAVGLNPHMRFHAQTLGTRTVGPLPGE